MMKNWRKKAAAIVALCTFALSLTAVSAKEDTAKEQLHVIFSHDIHSHLDSFRTSFKGKETDIGGMARMMTFIKKEKEEYPDTLLIDGGDFSMGTVYQMLYDTQAPELRMLGYLGYDATTLGNHEFDYRSQGLADMLKSAADSKDPLPAMVVCNVTWPEEPDEEQLLLQDAFSYYGVEPYIMVEKDGVKIALLGVFGKDALECAPTCALEFEDPVKAVKRTVEEIKEKEDADMIVCLSHSGTNKDSDKSEDEKLAKEVPDLDLILSGHTHTFLDEPIICGDTAIVSCGEYGEQIGSLNMVRKENGRWEVQDYRLVTMDKKIKEDPQVLNRLKSFSSVIDEQYLEPYGFTKDMVLAENPYSFSSANDLSEKKREHELGDLMADAFYYAAATKAEGTPPADVTVVPSGCVRDTFVSGPITAADVFKAYSLGIGPDGKAGYPLIGVYLTGEELRTAAEIDASISDYMKSARLYASGLSYTYNPRRMILNKVIRTQLVRQPDIPWQAGDGAVYEEIDDDKLYFVVADLYTGQMLGAVEKMSYGVLSVTPKDAQGNEIEDLESCILYDGSGSEIKAWEAIADYMQTFEKEKGERVVPAYYNELHDRKCVEDSSKPGDILKNPSKYAVIICTAATALIVVLVLVAVAVTRAVYRRRKGKR